VEGGRPEQPHIQELEPRGAFAIVNEAFVIYAVRFKSLIALNAVVQLPVAILALLPTGNEVVFLAVNFISTIVLTFAAAATIYAVGQHYALGRIVIGVCYARTLWRAVSLAILGLVSAIIVVVLLAVFSNLPAEPEAVRISEQLLWLFVISTLLAVLILTFIYLTLANPSVMFEGRRALGMFGRSIQLARGSELRILWNLIVYSIVFLGMMIVIGTPFIFTAGLLSAGGEISVVGDLVADVGGIAVSLLAMPVVYIATALLYFDIRVRKEGYTMSQLSREMGAGDDSTQQSYRPYRPHHTEHTEEQDDSDSARDG